MPPPWPVVADVRVVEPPAPVDLAHAPVVAASVTPVRLRDDSARVQARTLFLPGVGAFNAAVEDQLREGLHGAAQASGTRYTPTVFPRGAGLGDRLCVAGSTGLPAADVLTDPALGPAGGAGTALVCDVVAAADTFLGLRVRIVSGSAEEVASDIAVITYGDAATGEAVSAAGLWAEGAADTLSADIVDAVRRDAGALSLAPPSAGDDAQLEAIRAALTTTVPTAAGLAFTIAPGFSAPELTALGVVATTVPLTVEVPAAVAAELVSPFGARMLEAGARAYAVPARVGAGWTDCSLTPCVAVTYDDGPSRFTPGILDELNARGAVATFFALGQYAAGGRDTLRRMTAEGHEVENHTWNHPNLTDLTAEQVASQIDSTTVALEAASGQAVRVFRPPYGEFDASTLAAAGMAAILWDVDTSDYQHPSADVLVARAVDPPRPGSIVLVHDIHESTAVATPRIIDGLLDRGFTLVTVSQLFDGSLPTSGAWRRAP
ncbi:hypothetical protein GCM10022200_13860 [Microbacterium awajiense]|uniref:NodB homology domain-containing protein n=2 Tax=Microbacterium awajiense TaxID=415214 RepID=A0ABP7AH67_9MICO